MGPSLATNPFVGFGQVTQHGDQASRTLPPPQAPLPYMHLLAYWSVRARKKLAYQGTPGRAISCPPNIGAGAESVRGKGAVREGLAGLGALPSSKQVAATGWPEIPSSVTAGAGSFVPGTPRISGSTSPGGPRDAFPAQGSVGRASPDRPPELQELKCSFWDESQT